jgi:hypothetical protein
MKLNLETSFRLQRQYMRNKHLSKESPSSWELSHRRHHSHHIYDCNVGKLPPQISHEEKVNLVRKKRMTFLILLKLGKYIGFNICEVVLKDSVSIMQGR